MFRFPDPAEFAAETTALPVVVGPSVDATVTEEPAPVRSLSADLRLEPKSSNILTILTFF